MYPVDDPQGVRNPRPDRSYVASGTTGLQILNGSGPSIDEQGYQGEGSRNLQWGWNPVGGSSFFDNALTPNNLALSVEIGTVTVTTT
jgi:hypothetical protein